MVLFIMIFLQIIQEKELENYLYAYYNSSVIDILYELRDNHFNEYSESDDYAEEDSEDYEDQNLEIVVIKYNTDCKVDS